MVPHNNMTQLAVHRVSDDVSGGISGDIIQGAFLLGVHGGDTDAQGNKGAGICCGRLGLL
jgi:hypothetical protein